MFLADVTWGIGDDSDFKTNGLLKCGIGVTISRCQPSSDRRTRKAKLVPDGPRSHGSRMQAQQRPWFRYPVGA